MPPFAPCGTFPFLIIEGTPIPTVSEWGLIILTLLLLNMSLIFLERKKMFNEESKGMTSTAAFALIPFNFSHLKNTTLLTLCLGMTIGLINLGLYGVISSVDLFGTALAMPLFAYLLHLILLYSPSEKMAVIRG